MFDISDMASADVMGDGEKARGTDGAERNIYNDYEFIEELGKGSYGVVSRARRRADNEMLAVKHIDKRAAGAKGLREVFSEVEILSLLRHPSIVRLEEIYEDQNSLWLVMDLVEGGELEHELRKQGRFKEDVARRITRHILLALEYIHEKGIVHRDLKLANMLMSGHFEEGGNCEVKLADFGFSCVVSNESTLTSFCGTTVFMAPEILQDRPYGKPVDMWAVGVITFLVVYGVLPFAASNESDLLRHICDADFSFRDDLPATTPSKECKDFISKLIVVDTMSRLTATEALHHPWVKGINTGGFLDDVSSDASEPTDTPQRPRRPAKHKLKRMYYVIIAAHRLLYYRRLARLQSETDIPALKDFQYLVSGRFDRSASLSVSGVPLCMRSLQRLCDIAEVSKRLETLGLSCVNLSYDGLQMVVKSAAVAPRLTSLDLSGNAISAAGARALLRLARASKLKHINLKGTGVSGDILGQIDSALRESKVRKPTATHTQAVPSRGPQSSSGGPREHRNSGPPLKGSSKATSSSLPSLPRLSQQSPAYTNTLHPAMGTGVGVRRSSPSASASARHITHPTPRSKHNLEAIR